MDYTCMKWFSLEKKVWFLSLLLIRISFAILFFLSKRSSSYIMLNIVELIRSEKKEAWKFPVVVGDWWWGCPGVGCVSWPVEMED